MHDQGSLEVYPKHPGSAPLSDEGLFGKPFETMLSKTALIPAPSSDPLPESDPGPLLEVPYLQFPGLSRYDQLAHAVYTRLGGVSASSFSSLNASFNTGDEEEKVRANLRIIKDGIGAKDLAFMDQDHGTNILISRRGNRRTFDVPATADAMITDSPDSALLVKQADCQAVLFFDPKNQVIANAHCGWRGNAHNLLGTVVIRMITDFGCHPSDIMAAIGPSLGPCCAEFVTHDEIFPETFKRFLVRRHFFDLWEISRFQLLEAGLNGKNIELAGICTRCRTDLFYSYRAEKITGRFAAVIGLKGIGDNS